VILNKKGSIKKMKIQSKNKLLLFTMLTGVLIGLQGEF